MHEIVPSAVEFTLPDMLGRFLIVLVSFVPLTAVVWARRAEAARLEFARLARIAELPVEGNDIPAVRRRIVTRQTGRAIGMAVAMIVVAVILIASETPAGYVALLAALGASVGSGFGHVRPMDVAPGPRAAGLRRRELADYLTPIEVFLARWVIVLPVVAALIVGVGWAEWGLGRRPALISLAVLAAITAMGYVVRQALRRLVETPVTLATPTGRRWEEILRAVVLRDVAASGVTFVAGGPLFVLIALKRDFAELPVVFPVVAAFGVLAGVAILVVLGATVTDSHFVWARGHADVEGGACV